MITVVYLMIMIVNVVDEDNDHGDNGYVIYENDHRLEMVNKSGQ